MQEYFFLKDDIINDIYQVNFCLKKAEKSQCYRVCNINDKEIIMFLKVYLDGKPENIDTILTLKHSNLSPLIEFDEIIKDGKLYYYSCWMFSNGENLENKIIKENGLANSESINILLGILNGLKYLHQKGFVYGDLKAKDIILEMRGRSIISKITGLDRITYSSNVQQDIQLVSKLYFYLVTGNEFECFDDLSEYDYLDEKTEYLILRGVSAPTFQPFKDIDEFIQEIHFEKSNYRTSKSIKFEQIANVNKKTGNKLNGFNAVAGMEELKESIRVDIIDALNQKEKYQQYGISIPNGMLLYGPPGCGKTFFAERMAEEVGAKFYQLKPSDIQSKWVNASQENVKNLFNEAAKNSPSIIFIDELDAIVPSRDTDNISHMNTSVVNEFLAQMNNCSERGIFVIGATNRPNAIDNAILRSGRLDKHIYLPPPDIIARQKMFEIHLKNRPIAEDVNYLILAEKTENFVSSDIKFLCDEASRFALKNDCKISQRIVLDTIKNNQPSISSKILQEYQRIRDQFTNRRK